MASTVHPSQWKPAEPAGHGWISDTRPLPLHSEAPPPQSFRLLPASVLTGATFSNVLQHAALFSGCDQVQLAKAVFISKSYMTKFLGGVGERWAKLLVRFIRETQCLGALQWIANEVGCEVVVRDAARSELEQLRALVARMERAA